jgi:transposase-like protein
MNTNFTNFAGMMNALPTDSDCREYLELQRWGGVPTCIHCGTIDANHYKLKTGGEFKGMYKCRACKQRFTALLGTMFEGSPIPLKKWFIAAFLFSAHKKGVSSHQLARDLGVTQKTAWFMLHRLRQVFTDIDPKILKDVVSVDETFIGGKNKNRHADKKKEGGQGGNSDDKTIVMGLMQVGGIVVTKIIPDRQSDTVMPIITKMVENGAMLVTDECNAYFRAKDEFYHIVVNHNDGVYCHNAFSTNNIEGFWSLLKRGILGIYHSVTPKHLQKYCNEFGLRYNSRKITDKERFDMVLRRAEGVKLQYNMLIAK